MLRRILSCAALVAVGSALFASIATACSSFDEESPASDGATANEGGGLDGAEAGGEDGGTLPDGARAGRYVWIFGGLVTTGGIPTFASEAHRAKIAADATLGEWERVPSLDMKRAYAATIEMTPGFVLTAGGYVDPPGLTDATRDTLVADLAAVAPTWTAKPSLVAERGGSSLVVANSYLYLAAGFVSAGGAFSDDVMSARIDPGGSLSPWTLAGKVPEPVYGGTFFGIGDRLFFGGGIRQNGYSQATYTTRVTPDGGITGFVTAGPGPNTMNVAGAVSQGVVVAGGRAWAIAGAGGGGEGVTVVLTTVPDPDGGVSWAQSTPLPFATTTPCVVADGVQIYVLGGRFTDSIRSATVGRADPNGSITWKPLRDLPSPRHVFGCAIY